MNNFSDIKEKTRITLLQEAKFHADILKSIKHDCDIFKGLLSYQEFYIYSFLKTTNNKQLKTTNNKQLKTYLTLRFVQVCDKYKEVTKVILFLNHTEQNLNKLIEVLNHKESFTQEKLTFVQQIGVEINTLYQMCNALDLEINTLYQQCNAFKVEKQQEEANKFFAFKKNRKMIKVKNSKTTKLPKNKKFVQKNIKIMYGKNSIQHLRITELNEHKQTRDDLQQINTSCEELDRILKNFVTTVNLWIEKHSDDMDDEIKNIIKICKQKLLKVKKKSHELEQFFLVRKEAEKTINLLIKFWEKSDEDIAKNLHEYSSKCKSTFVFPQDTLTEVLKCHQIYVNLEFKEICLENIVFQQKLRKLKRK